MKNHEVVQEQTKIVEFEVVTSKIIEEDSSTIELSAHEVEFAFGHIIWGT